MVLESIFQHFGNLQKAAHKALLSFSIIDFSDRPGNLNAFFCIALIKSLDKFMSDKVFIDKLFNP